MSTFVFRKYAGYNPNEIKCWSSSSEISESSFDLEDIVFTRGASKAGTSIPSPLARLELFDTAFHIVSDDRKNNLKGKTIYHQLVSDCLDVMQLIFNSKNSDIGIGKKLRFEEWRVRENIDKLKSKGENHPNNLLAKSLEQIFYDRVNPRFNGVDSIFLIYYENKLLGGTSPLTLFFTSPNWSRYMNDGAIANIPSSSDGDEFFDDDYRPLHERDKAFVSYLYKLLLQNRTAFNRCEGLRKYIYRSVDVIEQEKPGWKLQFQAYINQPQNIEAQDGEQQIQQSLLDSEYSKILTNIDNKFLSINGIIFYHQIEQNVTDNIKAVSDFVIRASQNRYAHEVDDAGIKHNIHPPLVLVDGMNIPGDYMERNSPWNPNTKLKRQYYWGVNRLLPLYERKLPQGTSLSTVSYPFVTTDDFLEDSLIEVPFKVNDHKFFTGFNGDFRYLLPIKKEYFNYFSLDDLKKYLSITISEGQVKVNLKIPIRNKKGIADITFSRTYDKQSNSISEAKIGLGIFPFYKIINDDEDVRSLNDYTVLLADRNQNIEISSIDFFQYKNIITKKPEISTSVERSRKGITAGSKYYNISGSFDLIELGINDSDRYIFGLIIPEWPENNVIGTGKQYSFAIDFGTSNSHISYTDSRKSIVPQSFEIKDNDLQVVLLNKPENRSNLSETYRSGYGSLAELDSIVNREFMPIIFGDFPGSDFSFPIRTATCERADFKSNPANIFGNINIGFFIDHEESKPNDINYTTNLKWLFENNTDDSSNTKRIESFLTELLLIIRNKVILNNGEIKETKICWMKPQSMGQAINDQLIDAWNVATRRAFKNIEGIFETAAISESLAPYYYFKFGPDGNFKNRAADSINIDIGGGTTDVIYLNKKANNYISTSFRFAANDIWGSGIIEGLKDNGFIKNFLDFNDKNKRQRELADSVLDSFLSNTAYKSEDVVSLLFKYDNIFKFSESIKRNNPELLFIFYLHYSAIIFHVIQLLESKNIDMLPKYFTFTGKGSQYIRLMCGDDKLTEFTTLLLKSFTQLKIDNGFKVILSDKPKEVTANGGVLFLTASPGDKIVLKDEDELIHFGGSNEFNNIFRKGYTTNDKALKNQQFNKSVLSNLQSFIDKLLLVESENGVVEERLAIAKFLKGYNIKNLNLFYKELTNGNCAESGSIINDSYESYIDKLAAKPSQEISESFFFYGLKDSLYQLSKNIVESK